MTEEKKPLLHATSRVLCRIYAKLHEQGQVFFPLNDEQIQKVESISKTVDAVYFGVTRYKTHAMRAAAYFCLIIKNHAFIDGNKRSAVLFLQVYCDVFGLEIKNTDFSLDQLAVDVEAAKNVEFYNLISIIKQILFGNIEEKIEF
jgi:death-on-curing protein